MNLPRYSSKLCPRDADASVALQDQTRHLDLFENEGYLKIASLMGQWLYQQATGNHQI